MRVSYAIVMLSFLAALACGQRASHSSARDTRSGDNYVLAAGYQTTKGL